MIFLFGVGIALFIANIYFSLQKLYKLQKMSLITGKVIGHNTRKRFSGKLPINNTYAVVVECTVNNKTVKFTDTLFLFYKRYSKGKEVRVYIDPNNPRKKPVLQSFLSLWTGAVICFLLSGLFIWSGIAYYLGWKNFISPTGLQQTVIVQGL